jgi:hypothetical protein
MGLTNPPPKLYHTIADHDKRTYPQRGLHYLSSHSAYLDNVKLGVEAQPRWAVKPIFGIDGAKTANTISLLPNFEMVGPL